MQVEKLFENIEQLKRISTSHELEISKNNRFNESKKGIGEDVSFRALPLHFRMPALHMPGMGFQVGSFFVEMVIKLKVQVMGLKIRHDKDARNRTREFSKTVVDILGLKGNTFSEIFIMRHGPAPIALVSL